MTHIYNLQTGPFGLCSGHWDEKTQVFRRADETEQGDCCLRTCKPLIDLCSRTCPKAEPKYQELCYKTCEDISVTCGDFCKLSSPIWGSTNPIFKGIKEQGCGDYLYEPLNNECIKKNKDGIINICRQNCRSSHTLDCDKHCQYSYNIISDDKTNPLYFKKNIEGLKSFSVKNNKYKRVDNNIMYIIYSLVIVGIIFGMWILTNI